MGLLDIIKNMFNKTPATDPSPELSEPDIDITPDIPDIEYSPSEAANSFAERYKSSSYHQSSQANVGAIISDTGALGEMMVCNQLDRLPFYKKIITNVYLPVNSHTTEIDIICLTQKGIYIIENKNHGGQIYGNVDYKNWLEYYGGSKYSFYSPIKQNKAHIKAFLQHFPDVLTERIFSFITFSNRCSLKITGEVERTWILQRKDLLTTIQEIESGLKNIFTQEDMERIFHYLDGFARQGDDVKEEHIQFVESVKQSGRSN